jgi:glutamate-1-semialdehyde 2,1-aminomutase
LADGLSAAASAAGIPHQVQRVGSMMTLFFNSQPVHGWKQASQSNKEQFSKYFWGLVKHGVYMPCSQYEALFFSRMHTPELIDQTIDAAADVLKSM